MTSYNMNYHAQATSESNAQLVTNRGHSSTLMPFENAFVRPSSVACNVGEINTGVQCSEQIPSASATPSANFQMGASGSQLRTSLASHNQQRQGAPSSGGDHMKVEKNRLDTFIGWPRNAPVHASDLAAEGFYFIGVDDIVRCTFCHGTLKQWTHGDVVSIEHAKYFPQCPFVRRQDVGNVPLPPPSLQSPLQSFPIEWTQRYFPHQQGPVCPEYGHISRRQQSFVGHPLPVGQTAQAFAEAGFFYIGPEDNVKCFYCGGSLKTWQSSDKPWSEHMRWFPHCIFVRGMHDIQFQQLRMIITMHHSLAARQQFNGLQLILLAAFVHLRMSLIHTMSVLAYHRCLCLLKLHQNPVRCQWRRLNCLVRRQSAALSQPVLVWNCCKRKTDDSRTPLRVKSVWTEASIRCFCHAVTSSHVTCVQLQFTNVQFVVLKFVVLFGHIFRSDCQ